MADLRRMVTEEKLAADPAGTQLAEDQAVFAWLGWLALERSANTRVTYATSMRKLRAWMAAEGLHFDTLARADVLRWRAELRATQSVATTNLRLAALGSFYQYLIVEVGLGVTDPTARTKVKGNRAKHKRGPLTDAEMRALLAPSGTAPANLRDDAILAVMAYTGVRLVELSRARVEHLRVSDGRSVLWVQGKGHAEPDDYVVLPVVVEPTLDAWLAVRPGDPATGPLFTSLSNRTRGQAVSVHYLGCVVRARVRAACGGRKGVTPHSIRHTTITSAIRHGATPLQARAMARHSDINTTLAYYHSVDRLTNPAEDLVAYDNGGAK
ncbi:MAG: tyrosine-type recombinase/integrase [Gemmatimonadales bacterium]